MLAKIASMPKADRAVDERIQDGNVVCFFQSAHQLKARYATFGFNDKANLDGGTHGRLPLR